MNEASNQIPKMPPIQTTETFLLECSRSNSIIDKSAYKLQEGESNATWINSTDNFRIMKGDQISVEMIALNQAQTTTPMEFTGENVVLEGATVKPYVDNKVLLEVGYYVNNNQTYTNNLPFYLKQGINNITVPATILDPERGLNVQKIVPFPDATAITESDDGMYPGYGMGFGHKFNDTILVDAEFVSAFQRPNIDIASHRNSYRIVCFTANDYITVLPNTLPAGTNAYSVVLERSGGLPAEVISLPGAQPSRTCSINTFCQWKGISVGAEFDHPCYGKVGMGMAFGQDDLTTGFSQKEIVDIRGSTCAAPFADSERVQVCFPQDHPGFPNSGGMGAFTVPITSGRAACFTTPKVRYSDIFRSQGMASWNATSKAGTVAAGTEPNPVFTQSRQDSGITDFFSNGIQGFFTPNSNVFENATIDINLAYPKTGGGMTFFKGGGIGSGNRLQGTDNLPYIISRNDYMNGKTKANCEKIGRYSTFTPDLRPLTSFIELEATDLLMDATALASKINEKLHQSLPGVGSNSDDINQYHTNVYGFTRRYKKSAQLLPYNNYEGYFPNHAYPQQIPDDEQNTSFPATDETGYIQLTYLNTQIWNSIDSYFIGGCKQIIPANYQPGFNKIDFVGYNANLYLNMTEYALDQSLRGIIGGSYPSFETTYLHTCKKPPDWFGDSCSWNNTIDGNKGYKDIYKAMWGDSFNRIPIWDGNTRSEIGIHQGATSRNFNMPVILNTQLQNYGAGGLLLNPSTYFDGVNFDTTCLIKNQMIFTNIYYSEKSLKSTEYIEVATDPDWGSSFNSLRQNLVEKQRDYEIYINTVNKAADSQIKQQQDKMGWAIELDLGMTDDQLTVKYAEDNTSRDSTPIKVNWCANSQNPASTLAPPNPNFFTDWGLTPSMTSPWFGSGSIIPQQKPPAANGEPIYDWNKNQAVNRPVGRIQIQSKYDQDWLNSSNTGGELPYPDNPYPQLPISVPLNETACSFVDAEGKPYASDKWSRDNDMGIYPYQYTDVDGVKHIFCAFRVAVTYKAADNITINSQVVNTWRIGQLQWGLRFGYSPSAYDNYQVTPMNPDLKPHTTKLAQAYRNGAALGTPDVINEGLIQNANSYIAVGADNPTFRYDPTKSRMELLQTYKPTQLSPFNISGQAGTSTAPDLPGLGEEVAIFNDACGDAVYSPPIPTPIPVPPAPPTPLPVAPAMLNPSGGQKEVNQNQRSEETGIFIYKIWLPNENWKAPSDINLFSYWSHNEPDGQKFESAPVPPAFEILPNFQMGKPIGDGTFAPPYRCRDNQDRTENNREEIIENCTEASALNWRGNLLSKLGFTIEQLLPYQGRQYNRYSVNGYNNSQPDLIVTENTKPLILNCQSNITLDPAFNMNYAVTSTELDDLITNYPEVPAYTTSTPQPPLETVIPSVPSYIQYTPQPDLEQIIPAIPASSIIYNYDTEAYSVELITTDNFTAQSVISNRTINLNNYEFYMNFKDDGLGDVAGNYSDNNDRSITFDAGANNFIWVKFNSFEFEASFSTMYDRAGITATNTLTDLHLGVANLNNTIAPILSPLFYATSTTNPIPSVWNSTNTGNGTGGYMLPNKSTGTDKQGNDFTTHVGTWFQIQARYMRFWFHSDTSVQKSGWDMDICIEKRTLAVPQTIIYTPQPDIETVIPEVPSYIEYTSVPDVIENFPAVPAYSTSEPMPPLIETDTTLSGLPSYGLGFSNDQPVIIGSTDGILTATNTIESTNSPFFQIYSSICNSNYRDNGVRKNIIFYCMKNYSGSNYTFGYGSTFAHTATKSYNLDQIQTEIRNPITGRLMRILQPNSVLTYKITRSIILAPDVYDEDGKPLDPTDEPIASNLQMNTDELFNLVPPQGGSASGVAGGGLTAGAIPPQKNPPNTFFFDNNNQVVNLAPDQTVQQEEALLQSSFSGQGAPSGSETENKEEGEQSETKEGNDPNFGMSPFNQDIVEQGIIEQQIQQARDLQSAQDAVQQVEGGESKGNDGNPVIGGSGSPQDLAQDVDRSSMSNRVLLYDFLVHTTLNEIIPVNLNMFNDSTQLSESLARAWENIQRFAVGYTEGGGQTNPLSDIADLMDQGIISREEGLIQLGDLLFEKAGQTGSNTAFMINQNGKRVKRRGAGGRPTDEYFYVIHPQSAKEIAELLSTQRPPSGQVTDRLPDGADPAMDNTSQFTRELQALIKARIEDNNIVLQENKVNDGVLSVDTFIHDPEGKLQAYEQEYQFQRVPKEYYNTKRQNRSNRTGVMSDAQRLGANFDINEYLKSEAGGLGSQYLASIGADIPADQIVQGARLDRVSEEKFAEKEQNLGQGERSEVSKMKEKKNPQSDLRTSGTMLRAYDKVQEARVKQSQARTQAQKASVRRAGGASAAIASGLAQNAGGAAGGGAARGDGGGEEKKKE